jgi:hypothetical protein
MPDAPQSHSDSTARTPGEPASHDWRHLQSQLSMMQSQIEDFAAAQAAAVDEARRAVEAEFDAERRKLQDELAAERARFESEIAEQRRRIDAERNRLDGSRSGLEASLANLDERRQTIDAETAAIAAEREQLTLLDRDLQQRRQQLDQTTFAHQRHRHEIESERRSLAKRTEQLTARETELTAQREAIAQQEAYVQEMRAQVDAREKLINKQARRTAKALRAQNLQVIERINQRTADLDARAHRLEQARVHLRRRRERLGRARTLIKQRAKAVADQAAGIEPLRKAAHDVIAQREGLCDVQHLLAEAEHKMIHRWATHRGLPTAAALGACLLLLMTISWFVADSFATQTWRADALVEYESKITQTDRADWLAAQHRLLSSRNVLTRAATAMQSAGYTDNADADSLQQRAADGLRLYSDSPGRLQLELVGDNRRELTPMLAGLVEAYAGNAPFTEPGASPGSIVVVRRATLDPVPLSSNRFTVAVMIFGWSLSVIVALFLLARRTLVGLQSDRVIDVNLDINDQTWRQNVDLINRAFPGGIDDEQPRITQPIAPPEVDACPDPIEPESNPAPAAPDVKMAAPQTPQTQNTPKTPEKPVVQEVDALESLLREAAEAEPFEATPTKKTHEPVDPIDELFRRWAA